MNITPPPADSEKPVYTLLDTTKYVCKCSSAIFEDITLLFEFPEEAVKTTEVKLVPIKAVRCKECGDIIKDILPQEVHDKI